jgi:hypothetical protein
VIFTFLKIVMAFHPLVVRLGPHELKIFLKIKLTQPSLAEISAIFLYKGVYRLNSAINISG